MHPQLFGIEKLADILEETGWFESNLQEAFGELQREGKVENLDAHALGGHRQYKGRVSKNQKLRIPGTSILNFKRTLIHTLALIFLEHKVSLP